MSPHSNVLLMQQFLTFLVALCLGYAHPALAQLSQVNWLHTITTPNNSQTGDLINQVLRVDDYKQVTVMANFYSNVAFDNSTNLPHGGPNYEDRLLLARYANNGDLLWKKSLRKRGQPAENVFGTDCRLAVDAQGNAFVAGILRVDTLQLGGDTLLGRTCNNNCLEIFVIKFNNSGQVVWTRTLRATQGSWLHLSGIDCDAAGNVFLGGNTGGNGIFYQNQEILGITPQQQFVLKIGTNGNLIWHNTLADGSGIARCKMLRTCQDGSVYLSGDFDSPFLDFGNDVIAASNGNTNAFVEKIGPNGIPLWARTVSGNDIDLLDMSIDSSGRAYIAADAVGNSFVDGQLLLTSNATINAFLLVLDSLEASSPLQINYSEELVYPIFTTATQPNGSKFYTGGVFNSELLVGSSTLSANGFVDILLTEIDTANNVTVAGFGGTKIEAIENYNYGSGIGLDKDGYIYVIGYNNANGNFGTYNLPQAGIFLAKLNTGTVSAWHPRPLQAQVFPNPNNGQFRIDLPTGETEVQCTLADATGRTVFAQQLNASSTTLNLDLPSGCYALSLLAQKGVFHEKIIVQR